MSAAVEQARRTMRADVRECAEFAGTVPGDDDGRIEKIEGQVIARLFQFRLVPHANPLPGEEAVLLESGDGVVRIQRWRQWQPPGVGLPAGQRIERVFVFHWR